MASGIPAPVTSRVVLVTGAAAGIGLAAARVFAGRGDTVVLTDRDTDAVSRAALAMGAPNIALAMDVVDDVAVTRVLRDVVTRFGRIDVLVNNAAIIDASASPLIDIPSDTIRALLSVNVEGACRVAQAAARIMAKQGVGAIVNLSSGAALIGSPNRAAYATSKAAVIGMTRALAAACGEAGVRVNAVLPGYVATEMLHAMRRSGATDFARIASLVPLGRLAEPADIANAILHLADARHVHGALLVVDGGTTIHGGAGPASTGAAPIRPWAPGRLVVIVGGACGAGVAVADRFVSDGACVAIVDRDAPAAAAPGDDRRRYTADLDDEAALAGAFAAIIDELGPPAVLINAAPAKATGSPGPGRVPPGATRMMTDRLLATMLASRFAAAAMRDAGGGTIVNLLPAHDERSDITQASMAAAVTALTRNLACEWAGYGIRVNAVAPGGADPDGSSVVDTVAFLASDAASYITGAALGCDGVPSALATA